MSHCERLVRREDGVGRGERFGGSDAIGDGRDEMSSKEATKMDGVVGEVQAGDSIGEGRCTGVKMAPVLDGDVVARLATIDGGEVEGTTH